MASTHLNMPGLFTTPHISHSSDPSMDPFASAPRYPVASETSGRVTGSGVHGTRKRTISTLQTNNPTPWTNELSDSSRFDHSRSPPPLANDRYELAGGIEGPDMFARQNGDYDDYFQLQNQRGMWSTPITPAVGLPVRDVGIAAPIAPSAGKPWVLNQILNIVGGVAGKLVQFCSVPFRGFQAGGGEAYSFTPHGDITRTGYEDPFTEKEPVQGPLPGEFPEDNYGVLSIESLDNERPRMTKRLRTGESWVVVDKDLETDSRPSTPRLSERRVPGHRRSPSHIPRPASRTSMSSGTPKRPSLIPVSRRSTIDRKSFHGPSHTPDHGHSRSRSYSRQSYGSPATFKETNDGKKSPLPPDSQRLVNKMRREKLEDDARMRRMSSQMSAMLKEAREALGSKFEVEDDIGDGSGMDFDDGYADASPWARR